MPNFKVVKQVDGSMATVEVPPDKAQEDLEKTRRELKDTLYGSGWHVDPNAAPKASEPAAPQPLLLHSMNGRLGTLTAEADAEYDDWARVHFGRGCTCHISPPCSSCTHPGNPANLAEDDSAWIK